MANNPFIFSLLGVVLVFLYYFCIKRLMMWLARPIAMKMSFVKRVTYNDLVGIIELALIASSHVIFCASMVRLFGIPLIAKEVQNFHWIFIPYGILLGMSLLGISSMLCCLNMNLIEVCFPKFSPKGAGQWFSVSRGGWMRHHLQTFKNLPLLGTFFIILLQISSEEIVFRGVFFNYSIQYGFLFGFLYSLTLFVIMQSFQMNSIFGAMFPMTGALVMGLAHNVLYHWEPSVIPLIISHITFFLFAVI